MNSPAADFGIAPSTRAKLLRAIESVLGIERVWIFGSRAQGTQRPESDIDLAVSISADESHAMLCLSDQVQRVGLMYRVDLVCMQDKLEERFRKLIERDRKLFWEPRRPTTAATTRGAINLKDFQSAALDALAAYIAQLKPYAAQVEQNAQALRAMEGLPESVQREGAGKERAAVTPGHRWQPVRDGADAASRQPAEQRDAAFLSRPGQCAGLFAA